VATWIYRLLRWGQPYVDEGAEAYEKRYRDARLNYLPATVSDLGYEMVQKAVRPLSVTLRSDSGSGRDTRPMDHFHVAHPHYPVEFS
jgi:hypothetical protein